MAAARLARAYGLARSLAMYRAIPLRARRLRRFYGAFVQPGSLCFDIGAHAGNRVRCFRALGARVVAVEPQPDFAALLRRFHGRDPGVEIVEVAVDRAPGHVTLHLSSRTPTVSTTSAGWRDEVRRSRRFAGVVWDRAVEVPATTLDALIAVHGRPDFLKLDIEGAEAEALAGLSSPVAALSFEYVPASPVGARAALERVSRLGRYAFNRSEGESLTLAHSEWIDAEAMSAWLSRQPTDSPSGDIYARLIA